MRHAITRIEDNDLYWEKTLVEVDIPLLFVCKDESEKRYLVLCTDDTDFVYLVRSISSRDLVKMISGEISLRDIWLYTTELWKIHAGGDADSDEVIRIYQVDFDDLPEDTSYAADDEMNEYISILNHRRR